MEPIKNEYGDALTCEYCSVGAAVVEVPVADHVRQARQRDGYVDKESYQLCELCYLGSVRARGHLGYNTTPDTEIIVEKAVARMLTAFRGSLGS